jgi:hypothetical protein
MSADGHFSCCSTRKMAEKEANSGDGAADAVPMRASPSAGLGFPVGMSTTVCL